MASSKVCWRQFEVDSNKCMKHVVVEFEKCSLLAKQTLLKLYISTQFEIVRMVIGNRIEN